MPNLIEIAKLGRSVGVNGVLKCHLFTDFPEIFQKGIKLYAILNTPYQNLSHTLTLKTFDLKKHLIAFEEINSQEKAKALTNFVLFCTFEDTKKYCILQDEEFFWFDVIGCKVYEENQILGEVLDIQRIGNTDYLLIKTDATLSKNFAKTFLIPYIEPFIIKTLINDKTIFTKNTKALLEAS